MTHSISKHLRYTAAIIYGITAVLCVYGIAIDPGQPRADDIWFAALLCLVSASLVFGAVWVMLDKAQWRRGLGFVLLIPSLTIWGGILLLAFAGFRIH